MNKYKIFSSRHLIILILFVTLNTFIGGCYPLRLTDSSDPSTTKIYKIETTDGEIVDFRDTELGYALLSTAEVVCFLENGE